MTTTEARDVIIVGGGIAGSTLALRLTRAGKSVTLIEASAEFDDRVRGEGVMPWGVAEARLAGAIGVLEAAGAVRMPRDVAYAVGGTSERSESGPTRLNELVAGTGGGLAIRHPIACQALFDAAAEAGAETIRGYDSLEIGDDGLVTFTVDTTPTHRHARLLVGADGRGSQVRRRAGIDLEKRQARHYVAGLLAEFDDNPFPAHMVTATSEDLFMVYFLQGDGTHRVYLCGDVDDLPRYSGSTGLDNFMADLPKVPTPRPDIWASARAVGPCGAVRGDDSIAETVTRGNTVLIGDAAGYPSPITGQGLSAAFADVNDVHDAIVKAAGDTPDFTAYKERKRRRLNTIRWGTEYISATQAEQTSDRIARLSMFGTLALLDPRVLPALKAVFTGPQTINEDALPWDAIDQMRQVAPA